MASYEVEFSASGYMSFLFKDSSNNVVSGHVGRLVRIYPKMRAVILQSYTESLHQARRSD